MLLSLSLALLVTVSGALATYIYDRGASLGARLCTGACIGLAAFGLIGFVLASLCGPHAPLSIALGDYCHRRAVRFVVGPGFTASRSKLIWRTAHKNTPRYFPSHRPCYWLLPLLRSRGGSSLADF